MRSWKVVPKLLAMKNRKLLNEETFDKIEEITESDRHIVHYLAGSKKKSLGLKKSLD